MTSTDPEVGQLVRVRGQQWVVTHLDTSTQPRDELATSQPPGRTLVTLTSVSDDELGEELTVAWEVEPGREVLPESHLPEITEDTWDDPETLGAFLDAVRWGTVASADERTLQAPFRAGIAIEEYQLEPVAKALAMPRVNLLLADDVGLGKTIEAGLVIQEMLLRHRARRVLVVCPAPLTGKWRDEMADRFGLDFTVLDADALKALRRSHGLSANPFQVFPRAVISLSWLRTPRVRRLLDEVLIPASRYPGFFDILIVDEAHHCAPSVPTGRRHAEDSQRTRAVRRVGEYATHRLFLSATPHNGYRESWQALLEMLDPRRFARGVDPDPDQVRAVMVRRLKNEIREPDGSATFPGRAPRAIEVDCSSGEAEGYRLLTQYTRARQRATGTAAVRAADLVTLLLKKRLFSSPAAFAHTLAAHTETITSTVGAGTERVPEWLSSALDWDDEPADDEDTRTLFGRAEGLLDEPDGDGKALLILLAAWAERHAGPADSKANRLVAELTAVCRDADEWTDERVIVFTEYRDTQIWLADILTARGLGGDRLGLLHGGLVDEKRERLKASFQAAPDRDPVRILLATDAASEGIDLQAYCYRVIHYDIPFNPNRLEQRIGRLDRYGQRHTVDVAHFISSGWETAGPYERDLEYLSRVAHKVATERADLGSVNPVLARGVEARMLGRPILDDPMSVSSTPAAALKAERDLRAQVERLRAQLNRSVTSLRVSPGNSRRVVDTALELAGQPPLVDDGPGTVAPPMLKAGWERTVAGSVDPLSGQPLPLTFDPAIREGRDDLVLAHLGHPLVDLSTRLLRSAMWGGRPDVHRAAAVWFAPPAELGPRGPLVIVFARLVMVGGDGSRLHEEIILAGRELPEAGRTRRMDLEQAAYADLRSAVESALDPGECRPAPARFTSALAARWADLAPRLAEDVRVRAARQRESLSRTLADRLDADKKRTNAIYDQLRATLRGALADPEFVQMTLDDADPEESARSERDRRAWQHRLDQIDEDRDRELAGLRDRYERAHDLVFPFAVALCVPDGAR